MTHPEGSTEGQDKAGLHERSHINKNKGHECGWMSPVQVREGTEGAYDHDGGGQGSGFVTHPLQLLHGPHQKHGAVGQGHE